VRLYTHLLSSPSLFKSKIHNFHIRTLQHKKNLITLTIRYWGPVVIKLLQELKVTRVALLYPRTFLGPERRIAQDAVRRISAAGITVLASIAVPFRLNQEAEMGGIFGLLKNLDTRFI
jgi:hypothetical protein